MRDLSIFAVFISLLVVNQLTGDTTIHFPGCYDIQDSSMRLDCSPIGLEKKMGCSSIRKVPTFLSALSPTIPMVECRSEVNEKRKSVLVHEGCGWLAWMTNYIVFQNSDRRLIDSPEEFRKTFAPVETPDEALAFALAMTTSYPMFKIEIPADYIRLISSIEPTFVKKQGDDFIVHLFDYMCHGCGLHPFYYVNYYVSREGLVTEIARTEIYRNPKEDNVCMD